MDLWMKVGPQLYELLIGREDLGEEKAEEFL